MWIQERFPFVDNPKLCVTCGVTVHNIYVHASWHDELERLLDEHLKLIEQSTEVLNKLVK